MINVTFYLLVYPKLQKSCSVEDAPVDGNCHRLTWGDHMRIPIGRPGAIAHMTGNAEMPCLYGTVKFYAAGNNVLVVADICGLPNSPTDIFALHIHEGKGCGSENFAQTGGHYNPSNQPHPVHAGDLPPLFSCNGRAFLAVLTGRFCLRDVIGKTVVIHNGPDDFTTQPAGNSGNKIACGTIVST